MTSPSETVLDIYRWTVEDYHRLGKAGILDEDSRVELLNGQIVKMSPTGNLHAGCVDRLGDLFRELLGKSAIIRVQNPVILNLNSEPEPDLSILKRKNNFYTDGHPRPEDILLIVEVADTTLEKDRTTKKKLYAAAGITEYWIINLPDRQVEQYLDPFGEDYRLVHICKSGQAVESTLLGSVPVDNIQP
ncbi:MAG: Uma2 family endonuclease [Phaeodactylibacter sp.]|nr:Uma2 family endonuclease [Phaeodactylibacter sp.]